MKHGILTGAFLVVVVFVCAFILRLEHEQDKTGAPLCTALQLRTCTDETLRQAFAAQDYRIAILEQDVAAMQAQLAADEAKADQDSKFKKEVRK